MRNIVLFLAPLILGAACRQPTPPNATDTTAATAAAEAYADCHQATNFGFNRLQRPLSNPYPDQVFAPPKE